MCLWYKFRLSADDNTKSIKKNNFNFLFYSNVQMKQFWFNQWIYTKKKCFSLNCKYKTNFLYFPVLKLLQFVKLNILNTISCLLSGWMGFVKWLRCDFDCRMDSKNAKKRKLFFFFIYLSKKLKVLHRGRI